jgi:hypothetical protein
MRKALISTNDSRYKGPASLAGVETCHQLTQLEGACRRSVTCYKVIS